ncbi:MAG: M20/M25/M40 family metallo-hydrolase [Acidimicrobiales bacterium]|nr:M20/M25/M40 family metallo-hydrolase [Acidimicrobiales bacterium]
MSDTNTKAVANGDAEAGEVVELLQQLIRNACVNDGSEASGGEIRSAEVLRNYLEGSGLDVQIFESAPGRASVVTRIEGSDPAAPTLLLMGHTDVVPVNPDHWREDPFGGELIDGEVWGRGAVDMLNLTASMAVATKRLARSGFRPRGTLIYLGVADEEALGAYGAEYLLARERDAVAADYVITESGGIPLPSPNGIKLPVIVGEKGSYWCRIVVHGIAGHGSQPFRTDNALVKAAEVVRRIAAFEPQTQIHEVWRTFIESMGYPDEFTGPLLSSETFRDALEVLPDGMARQFHACTHTTFAPTVVRGGSKINTIPDQVELEVDVRTLPGQTAEDVEALLSEAIGDLASFVDIHCIKADESTASPIDTPLWDTLSRVTQHWYPGSKTVPYLTVGATDARFFRRHDSVAYGFGLFSQHLSFEDYGTMFHGDNERVDVESLRLSTELWEAVARDLLA